MKKILSVLLALCLLVGALPMVASAAEEKFTIENGELIMYEGPGGDVVIPHGVTRICNDAFSRAFMTQADLRTVTIPSSVRTIDIGEFEGFDNLTKIIVDPDNTSYVDVDGVLFAKDMKTLVQFPGGKASENYYIPSSVTEIGEYAFASTKKLRGVVIPDGVTEIKWHVFWKSSSLASVFIPDSVTVIYDDAFSYCTNLTSITIPSSVNSIGYTPFDSCTKLQSIKVAPGNSEFVDKEGVLFTKDMKELIQYPAGKASDNYIIPDGVTNIEDNAFQGCSSLKCVTFPRSMTVIDDYAFYMCSSLTRAILLDGVKSIGFGTFVDCTKLASITIPSSLTTVEGSAFTRCSSLKDIYYGGTQAQWNKIQIANTVFDNNEHFTSAKVHYNSTGPNPPSPNVGGFTDVKVSAYYAKPVVWAVEKKITAGKGSNTFKPDDKCTRGEIMTFLWNAAGKPEPKSAANPFGDVKENDFYYKAVLWAVENNITSGTSATTFSPKTVCTRAQAMTFIWNARKKPAATVSNPFTDVKGGYYYDAVLWAVGNKVTSGTSATTFSPGQDCTRGQIVTFLYNAKDL